MKAIWGRIAVVGARDPRPPDLEFSDRLAVARSDVAGAVDDTRLDSESHPSGLRAIGPGIVADGLAGRDRDRGEGARLGHSPCLDDLDAVELLEALHKRERHSRAAADDAAER